MQWTIHRFYRIFTTRFIIWALSFVLYSGILLPVAVADDSATLQDIEANTSHLSGMATVQSEIETILDELNTRTRTNLPYLNYLPTVSRNIEDIETLLRNLDIPDYSSSLSTLKTDLSGLKSQNHTDLSALSAVLQLIYARQNYQTDSVNSGFGQVSNLLERIASKSSGGDDVLAGNPWWATNSAFALTQSRYSLVYPHETPDSAYSYSFPQFLSKWSAMLCYPWSGSSIGSSEIRQKWWTYWGRNRYGGGLVGGISSTQPYTWFDWMADATRSNWTAQASMYGYVSTNVTSSDLQSFAATDPTTSDSLPSTNSLSDLNLSLGYLDGNPFEEFQDSVDSLLPSLENSGSANLVVIPEMTIGGIHVPIGQSDFLADSDINTRRLTDFVRVLMLWAWRLLTLIGIFYIVRSEWGYWSTLGGSSND